MPHATVSAHRRAHHTSAKSRTSPLADAVRQRKTQDPYDGGQDDLLRMLDAGEDEATPLLLTAGGLFSFRRDSTAGTDGIEGAVGRVIKSVDPNHDQQERVLEAFIALADAHGLAQQAGSQSDEAGDVIFLMRKRYLEAAYCLGLAVGRLLAGGQ